MRWAYIILAGWLAAGAAGQAAQTQARLLLDHEIARPGQTVWAGVQLRMPDRWHTYWRNPGDSGAATKIDWTLPPGVTAGPILWPLPEKYLDKAAGLTTYVYHHEVVLLVPLTLAGNLPSGSLAIQAKVAWLECESLCMPGKAEVQARLGIGDQPKPSPEASLLAAAQKRLPRAEPKLAASAWWQKPLAEESRSLLIEWQPVQASAKFDFYPYGSDNLEIAGDTESVAAPPGKARLRKQIKKLEGKWPDQISGLLIEAAGSESPSAYTVTLPISQAARADTGAAVDAPAPGPGSSPASLAGMLGLAFLGGLILNIMPCVLPVIALKILGFVRQSKEAPQRVKKLGLVYTLGVLCSFLALAGLVILAERAGRAASWGMQFQNPQFIIVMATLVTLVALNLFGVFEVALGGRALGAAAELSGQEGSTGAFFNGVLATALATPCTAPFLAVALGFAFTQSPGVIILMFLIMGLGLATPYLVLSWFPRWLKLLPKPGAWMEKFKIAMGFPMLATAVWLLTLTTDFYGGGGPLWVGLFLVVLGFAAWIWGSFVQRQASRKGFAAVLSLLLVATGYAYGLEKELNWRFTPPPSAAKTGAHETGGIAWQPWAPAALAKARAEGRPVLVDFTADWCVTCQANKKTSLEIPAVRQKLRDIGAVALLGDYTRENPEITRELRRFGRAGVPLVLVYPRDAQKPPLLLPSILTPGIVLDALSKAEGGS